MNKRTPNQYSRAYGTNESNEPTRFLRHASKRSSGTWGPDDWDVIDAHGRDIGRIFKASGGVPEDRPWQWTITGAVVAPRLPSHGFAASREEAMAAFAGTWRAARLIR
jgi:hypothetical protein